MGIGLVYPAEIFFSGQDKLNEYVRLGGTEYKMNEAKEHIEIVEKEAGYPRAMAANCKAALVYVIPGICAVAALTIDLVRNIAIAAFLRLRATFTSDCKKATTLRERVANKLRFGKEDAFGIVAIPTILILNIIGILLPRVTHPLQKKLVDHLTDEGPL